MAYSRATCAISIMVLSLSQSMPGLAQAEIDCSSFRYQEQAQFVLDRSDLDGSSLDDDDNGLACEDLASAGPSPSMPDLPEDRDFSCPDFAYREMAQSVLDDDDSDPHNLDPNEDGIACSSLPTQSDYQTIVEETAPTAASSRGNPRRATTATRSSSPGSRVAPLPLGTAADIGGGWIVSVVEVDFDATDVILAENMFNEPPDRGQQFVLITISATYEGTESSSVFLPGLSLKLLGISAVAYDEFDPGCGVTPNDFPSSEVFSGGTLTGTICFAVDSEDVASLVMFGEEYSFFGSDEPVWYALR